MASIELEPSIKQALKCLHSNARDSMEQVRLLLDEVIRHNCGNSKTMSNVLPKKYLLEERNDNYQKHKHKGESSKSSSTKTVPMHSPSPQQIQIPEQSDEEGSTVMDGELTYELLDEDLACAVCRQMAVQAGNRLVECEGCQTLYHQDCHKPAIRDSDMESGWQCSKCLAQVYTINSVSSSKSGFSSSSSSTKSSPGKHIPSVSSLKISSSVPATTSKIITPNINIISADKRLQIMKKKAAKQQENKRKHSK